jgi:Tol biopolymer transport system component
MSKFIRPASIFLTGVIVLTALFTISCAGTTVDYKPSGLTSLLAFSSDRDKTVHIYTCKPDGMDITSTSSEVQTFDGAPMWSPDGTRIVFNSNDPDNYEIWSMKADGSDRKRLTSRTGLDTVPRYSPDGTKVVFVGEFREDKAEEETATYEIMTVNSDGSNMTRLTTSSKSGTGWNSVPTWSPDGSKILFSTNRELVGTSPVLYIMNPDGSNQQRFGFLFPVEGTMPDWSPVTNKIVFVKGSAAKGEIWVMDAGFPFPGLAAKKLTDNSDNNRNPVWSPDGKQIAFVSDTYGNDDIFIMNADGTNLHRVTYDKSSENHPAWR